MAIKFKKNDYQCNPYEMIEEFEESDDNDFEIYEDDNSNNNKSITKNKVNILYFAIIGIIIALCFINNSTYKEPKNDPLTKILIPQKLINQTTSDEFINATNIPIQRRYRIILITTETETKETETKENGKKTDKKANKVPVKGTSTKN